MSPTTFRILLALFVGIMLLFMLIVGVVIPTLMMRSAKTRSEEGLRNSEAFMEETRLERQRDIERAEQGLEMQRRGLELAERSMKAQEDMIALLRELVARQRSAEGESSA